MSAAPASLHDALINVLGWPDWDPEDQSDPRRLVFPAELVLSANLPDSNSSLSNDLDLGKVDDTIRNALSDVGIKLPPGDTALQVAVVQAGAHWRITEATPATFYRVRIHRQADKSLNIYGGLRAERLVDGWLNRDGLTSAPDEVQQSTRYLVPLGPTNPVANATNLTRAALVYESGSPDTLVSIALSRSGNPTDGVELPVVSATNTPLLAVLPAGGDTWSIRPSLGDDATVVPVRVVDSTATPPTGAFSMALDVSRWLDPASAMPVTSAFNLDGLAVDPHTNELVASTIRLAFSATSGFLNRACNWTLGCDGEIQSPPPPVPADLTSFQWDDNNGPTFADFPLGKVFGSSLPFAGLTAEQIPLTVRPDADRVALGFKGDLPAGLSIPLTGPAVRFGLAKGVGIELTSLEGLALSKSNGVDLVPHLMVNLFTASNVFPADIVQAWSRVPGATDADPFPELLKLGQPDGGVTGLQDGDAFMRWSGAIPEIRPEVLVSLASTEVNPNLRLQTLAGPLPGEIDGALASSVVRFQVPGDGAVPRFELAPDQTSYRIVVPITLALGHENGQVTADDSLFELDGELLLSLDVNIQDASGFLPVPAGSFQVDPTVNFRFLTRQDVRFGDMISLHVPAGTVLTWVADPADTVLFWNRAETLKNTTERIAVRIPGAADLSASDNRFTFEIREFSVGQDGFSMVGQARADIVNLSTAPAHDGDPDPQTGFAEPLQVAAPTPPPQGADSSQRVVGEIELRNSQLVYGSLQATTRLNYFDDANVTLSFAFEQPRRDSMTISGGLTLTQPVRFRVDALFTTFAINQLTLGTQYRKSGTKEGWSTHGTMSGQIVFEPPPDGSSADIGPAEDLFQGLAIEFTDFDPVRVGLSAIGVSLRSPLEFKFGDIFTVSLQAAQILPEKDGVKALSLRGGIEIDNLAGCDANVEFDELVIRQVGNKTPEVTINAIGIDLTLDGGSLHIVARLGRVDNPLEFGYEGAVSVETDLLDKLSGSLKLTRVVTPDKGMVPSCVIFFETQLEVMLFTNLFLRSLGLGIAINQTLRNLPDMTSGDPIDQLIHFVTNPAGLPNPSDLNSWVPSPPNHQTQAPRWLLVGTGLVTFGDFPTDQEHLLTGSILLCVSTGGVIAGANVWVMTSPDQAQTQEFLARPVGRGAMMLSVRDRSLTGVFTTLPNPMISPRAPATAAIGPGKNPDKPTFQGRFQWFPLAGRLAVGNADRLCRGAVQRRAQRGVPIRHVPRRGGLRAQPGDQPPVPACRHRRIRHPVRLARRIAQPQWPGLCAGVDQRWPDHRAGTAAPGRDGPGRLRLHPGRVPRPPRAQVVALEGGLRRVDRDLGLRLGDPGPGGWWARR